MIRSALVLFAAVALCFVGIVPAGASPSAPPCSFTLSPPQVVQLSGTNVVTATLSPAACDQSDTYLSVACVQLQGILPAQVHFAPYRPGATYVSTGRGCSSKGNPPQPFCRPAGPLTATL